MVHMRPETIGQAIRLVAWTMIAAIGLAIDAPVAGAASTGVNAPEFSVMTLAGERYTKATMDGHPTLLVFWAPWCKVCQQELPVLGDYVEREKPAQLRVLSIGFADTRERVNAFVKARKATFVFPTAYDEGNRMAREYRINATPTFVLVDAHGQVVMIHRGGGLLGNVEFREFVSALKG
jgi:thiol-disulfide isomerase/thioredoxin